MNMTPNRALGVRTSAAPTSSPFWQLLRGTASPVLTPKVVSLTANLVTPVETELLLIKSATLGVASGAIPSNRLFDAGEGDANQALFATAWSSLPTIGGAGEALSRVILPGVVGASVIWDFEEGELEVQDGESLLLWNIGPNPGGLLNVSCFFQGN